MNDDYDDWLDEQHRKQMREAAFVIGIVAIMAASIVLMIIGSAIWRVL
jgi:hypothetical protein